MVMMMMRVITMMMRAITMMMIMRIVIVTNDCVEEKSTGLNKFESVLLSET